MLHSLEVIAERLSARQLILHRISASVCIYIYIYIYIYICTIMHLYMKGTAQGISAIHPSGSFELSIYPRVYGCQAKMLLH